MNSFSHCVRQTVLIRITVFLYINIRFLRIKVKYINSIREQKKNADIFPKASNCPVLFFKFIRCTISQIEKWMGNTGDTTKSLCTRRY